MNNLQNTDSSFVLRLAEELNDALNGFPLTELETTENIEDLDELKEYLDCMIHTIVLYLNKNLTN